MKTIAHNLKQLDQTKCMVTAAGAVVLGLFVLYVYLLSSSVLHVVLRQEVERQIGDLHSEIAKLEASYIEAQHSVSEDIASLQGYVAADKKVFIDRTDTTAVALRQDN